MVSVAKENMQTIKCTVCKSGFTSGSCSGVRGDFSLVVDGFRCKPCDDKIQEVNLEVGGETYGCVKSFCYLGGTLDDGGDRIRSEWIKIRGLLQFLISCYK